MRIQEKSHDLHFPHKDSQEHLTHLQQIIQQTNCSHRENEENGNCASSSLSVKLHAKRA